MLSLVDTAEEVTGVQTGGNRLLGQRLETGQ